MSNHPILDCIRRFDENTWVICDTLVLSQQTSPSSICWSDGDQKFFALSKDLKASVLHTQPLFNDPAIRLVHNIGEHSAVWKIGEAYCKIKAIEYADCTLEHTTLDYIRRRQPRTFKVPDVVHWEQCHGWYLTIQSAMPGNSIAESWWSMSDEAKANCIRRAVLICKEMAGWGSTGGVCGADGLHLSEQFLASGAELDMSPKALLTNCLKLGMDCSTFHFFHCDMSPDNVFFDDKDGSMGIIDWETAGYVPKEWIRTKFRLAMAFDLPGDGDKQEWRRRIQLGLGEEGYDDVAGKWTEWQESLRRP